MVDFHSIQPIFQTKPISLSGPYRPRVISLFQFPVAGDDLSTKVTETGTPTCRKLYHNRWA